MSSHFYLVRLKIAKEDYRLLHRLESIERLKKSDSANTTVSGLERNNVGKQQKAILVLDNVPPYLSKTVLTSNNGLSTIKYLPLNFRALIQPVDQATIAAMK